MCTKSSCSFASYEDFENTNFEHSIYCSGLFNKSNDENQLFIAVLRGFCNAENCKNFSQNLQIWITADIRYCLMFMTINVDDNIDNYLKHVIVVLQYFMISVITRVHSNHDDVIKWKHFPRYWPFVREIHRPSVNSPHKGQWRGALMFSLICIWINGWVNNCEAGDLRCYRAHFDVIVMTITFNERMSIMFLS